MVNKMVNSRTKGSNFELLVAKALQGRFGGQFRRTPLSGGWSHSSKETKGDIVCVDRDNFPYCVECKNAEGWTLESLFTGKHQWLDDWWKQTVDETPEGKVPLLVFTRNHQPAFGVMQFADWMAMSRHDKGSILLEAIIRLKFDDYNVIIGRFDDMLTQLRWSLDKNANQ